MDPYNSNPFATDTARDTRSEYDANRNLARNLLKFRQALENDLQNDALQSRDKISEYYHMGVKHGCGFALAILED